MINLLSCLFGDFDTGTGKRQDPMIFLIGRMRDWYPLDSGSVRDLLNQPFSCIPDDLYFTDIQYKPEDIEYGPDALTETVRERPACLDTGKTDYGVGQVQPWTVPIKDLE